MAEINVTGLTLDDARLAEIQGLLRYGSSVSFTSYRAAESMLLLLAEYERIRPRQAGPSIHVGTWYLVNCATPECPARLGHDDETGSLWPDLDGARRFVAEQDTDQEPYYRWQVDGDVYRCGACTTRADCAAVGHEWSDWENCYCGGQNSLHVNGGHQHRTCEHCYETDRTGPVRPCQDPTPFPAADPVSDDTTAGVS